MNTQTESAFDFRVENHGSVCLVFPLSEQARDWVENHVPLEGWQWFGGGFAVEPRYLHDLVDGMREEGLHQQESV